MPGPLSAEEIIELRNLASDAAPGVWKACTFRDVYETKTRKALPRLLDELERSRAMLKRLEWSRLSEATGAFESSCPVCLGAFGRHDIACELAALTWPR